MAQLGKSVCEVRERGRSERESWTLWCLERVVAQLRKREEEERKKEEEEDEEEEEEEEEEEDKVMLVVVMLWCHH